MKMLDELREATRSPEQSRELVAQTAVGMNPRATLALQEAVRVAVKLSQHVGRRVTRPPRALAMALDAATRAPR